ncbi:unnamed protein product [Adineta steineri]|uniref:Uncharacterized protein n=1 Tax=Adineta steineri TaxID=433720 RepID=A0A815QGB8_9BILA|nr:unnamed protein product [Adineta steineri]CAF1462494.1 unnamed protein product [Adineta steineri]
MIHGENCHQGLNYCGYKLMNMGPYGSKIAEATVGQPNKDHFNKLFLCKDGQTGDIVFVKNCDACVSNRLVKRWTQYSRKGLDADILRFSTLHSWYKHLEFENGGSLYFIWPQKGQQLRYSFDPCVTDDIGLHWHFISNRNIEIINDEKVREIITRHPFRLNPFFYHDETRYSASDNESSIIRAFYGSDIILSRYRSSLKPWLENNYPDFVEKIFNSKDSNNIYTNAYDEKLVPIFDGEWSKAMNSIREAAKRV